jgi:hypothetical protein
MKRTRATQAKMCLITLLPKDIIKYTVGFLNHDDKWSLNQTCKPLRKYVPHKCVPPFSQKISYCHRDRDLERLKNGELALSKRLILDGMPLDSELLNLIRNYCPKLKYLFIKYSCKCDDVLMLNFENLTCVEISIKINMFDMDCTLSICNLSLAVESFTAHISGIDPVTFKTIPAEYKRIPREYKRIPREYKRIPRKYKRIIDLNINNLENLKSL